MKIESFLALEGTVAATLHAGWTPIAKKLMRELQPLIEAQDFGGAYDVVNRFTMIGMVEDQRKRLEELAVSSVLFGAHNVTGSVKTTSFANGNPLPDGLARSIDQLTIMIEDGAAHWLRTMLLQFIAAYEEGAKLEQLSIQKKDMDLADRLNAAVLGNGKGLINIGANLTTSRLVSLGFLAEAADAGYTTYQVNEVLDKRTCPVCQYMNGKTFNVAHEHGRTLQALSTIDPQELKSTNPFPKQSKAGLTELFSMTNAELQASGLGSPPYHPSCRGILVLTGTVEAQPVTGKAREIIDALIADAKAGTNAIVPGLMADTTQATVSGVAAVSVTSGQLLDLIGQIRSAKIREQAIAALNAGDFARVKRLLTKAGISYDGLSS